MERNEESFGRELICLMRLNLKYIIAAMLIPVVVQLIAKIFIEEFIPLRLVIRGMVIAAFFLTFLYSENRKKFQASAAANALVCVICFAALLASHLIVCKLVNMAW